MSCRNLAAPLHPKASIHLTRALRRMRRAATFAACAVATCGLLATAPSVARADLKFAVSGIHHLPETVWSGLTEEGKLGFIAQRADLAVAMGASALRIGATTPSFWDFAGLGGSSDTGRWMFADKVVATLAQRNLTLVVVVPDVVGSGLTAYRNHIKALAERYDGDNDFGVPTASNNKDFPDIDDTGAITSADWGAPASQLAAWAQAHTIDVVQLGHQPSVAEQAGTITGDDYGSQLKQGSGAVRDSNSDLKVMLAGTVVDTANSAGFQARLGTVSSNVIDIADAHVLEATKDPTGEDTFESLDDFTQWLTDADLGAAERWVGAFAATSSPAGPCGAWTCDDRMQVANLVKGMLAAVRAGATHFSYDVPVEVTGAAAEATMPVGTGLLFIDLAAGADVSATPIAARPAFATWMRLQTILGDVSADDIAEVGQLGPNTAGYRIGDKGWLVWYDWTTAVSPGSAYDGSKRGASLKGIPASVGAVAASTLFPVAVDATLGASYTVNADWDNKVYTVNGGEAIIELGADVVWIVPSEPAAPEAGPESATEAVVDTGAAEPDPTNDGGCDAGTAPTGPLTVLLASFAVLAAALRRRRG